MENKKVESSLAPLLVALALLFAGALVTIVLLVISGFLTMPLFLFALLALGSIGLLAVGIKAAMLSRRPASNSESKRLLVLLGIAAQLTQPAPLRFGAIAQQLSEQDVVEILRIAAPDRAAPAWLLLSVKPAAGPEYLRVFLKPTKSTPAIRRGTVVSIRRDGQWVLAGPSPTGDYAQVALKDRPFDEIQNDRDFNLPFGINGRFDDKEIIELINDVRPRALPGFTLRGRTAPRAIRALIRDTQSTVRVEIQDLGYAVYRREGGAWVFRYIQNIAV
jgi:hypothetical protein